MSKSPYSLTSERLLLRSLGQRYAQMLLDYNIKNREYLQEWINHSAKNYYTLEKHKYILKNKRALYERGSEYRYYLFEKDEQDTIIGDIGFSQVVRGGFHSCYLGYQIDQDHRGKGYIPEAIATGIEFLFESKNLHRIEANVMPGNKASIRVVEKLGFIKEGYSKDYLLINGQWEDHERWVLFNEDWQAPKF